MAKLCKELVKEGASDLLSYQRTLPDAITFGASIRPVENAVEMELWLRNFTDHNLNGIRAAICVMLKGARDFNAQTNDNKLFQFPVATVRSATGDRWIKTAWEPCLAVDGNRTCPCMHSDP